MERVDKILFINPENPKEQTVFNFQTWCMLIEGIIVKYGHKTDKEAHAILINSHLYTCLLEDIRNKDYEGLFFYQHELEYHWAMLLTFGELYWHHGISSIVPEEFDIWERKYLKEHNLAESSFINLENE